MNGRTENSLSPTNSDEIAKTRVNKNSLCDTVTTNKSKKANNSVLLK